MIEKQFINNKDVWIKVDPHPIERENAHVIPTEYFTATYYFQDPAANDGIGILMKDDNGEVKFFESPVAALGYASKKLETVV
jgi:hypothetical protein